MAEQTPMDAFRQVLGGAAGAMAQEPELELNFTADAPSANAKSLKVPMPSRAPRRPDRRAAHGSASAP